MDEELVAGIQRKYVGDSRSFWIPDTMKNMVAGAPYFSIVRE